MRLKHVTLSLLALAVGLIGTAVKAQAATFEVFAEGLDNARGLSFGPDGLLYVTELGSGKGAESAGCFASAEPGLDLCLTNTGALTRIDANGMLEGVVDGLPSLALGDGFENAGPQDIEFDAAGNPYIVYGYLGDPARRDVALNAIAGNPYPATDLIGSELFGSLLSVDFATGELTQVADLAEFELLNNFDSGAVESNPNALAIANGTAYITDGSSNSLLTYGFGTEELSQAVLFPTEDVPTDSLVLPGPPPMSLADAMAVPPFSLQYVPTSVAIGPDGAAYVTEFTGFPFPQGAAEVTRVGSDGELSPYVDGLTQLTDLAWAPNGDLYAIQFANESSVSGGMAGSLLRIAPDGAVTTLLSGDDFPEFSLLTGLAYGPDDAVYVTSQAAATGSQILRVDPFDHAATTPEPTLALSLLLLSLAGTRLTAHNRNRALGRSASS